MKTLIQVDGMVCSNCKNAVEASLLDIAGVKSAQVCLEDKTVVVEYDDSKVSVKTMCDALEEIGFTAAR